MWVFVIAHLILSTRFMLERLTKQRQNPMLDIAIGKKYATGK